MSHGSDLAELLLQRLYAIDKESEVVSSVQVGMGGYNEEIVKSFAADGRNVGIVTMLTCASHLLKILNQAVLIANSQERPAEAFIIQSDQ